MPDATTPGAAPPAERTLTEQALANLVDQFARPLDFLRELVQNAIDAGSPRVDVWVDHTPGDAGSGVLMIGVDDHGSGMDEATIDGKLLRLYASTKEDDRTKIGKFGIGFTSVFALRPDRVLVRTGRHGTWWELVAGPDRVFHKHRSEEPISGTQVLLLKRVADERIDPLVEEIRSVLGYWCEHALIPITFEDRRGAEEEALPTADPFAAFEGPPRRTSVQRPMDLEEARLTVHERVPMPGLGEVEVVLGYASTPSWGFYNGGLTLLRTRDDEVLGDYAPRLGHLAFKVRSDHLEHTLTRDNVRRDAAWRATLDAVTQVHVHLRDQLLDRAAAAAVEGGVLPPWHRHLFEELEVDPSFAARVEEVAVLRAADGQACSPRAALAHGEALVAGPDHPLVAPLRAEGRPVIADHPTTRRLLQRLLDLLHPSRALPGAPRPSRVLPVDQAFLRAHPIDVGTLEPTARQLFERTEELLAAATALGVTLPFAGRVTVGQPDPEQVGLRLARFDRAAGLRGPLCVEGPDDGSLFRAPRPDDWRLPPLVVGRTLLVDVDHPTFALHRASAHQDVELAAVGLAHAVLHADGVREAGPYVQLLDATRWEAP